MTAPSTQYRELIEALEAFICGARRSRDDVRRIEGLFGASALDEDERFSDLQSAIALFGAGKREDDEQMLASECRHVLKLLR